MPNAKPKQCVECAQRVVKKLAAVVNAREARPQQEFIAHPFLPQRLNLWQLGEEAVSADVEQITAIALCAGNAANNVVLLNYQNFAVGLRKLPCSRQACRPGADHNHICMFH